MSIIEIFDDGIKISYSLFILMASILIWFNFIKTRNENVYSVPEHQRYQSDYKMTICVRQDLGMGKGKIASQCGHAILGAYKKAIKNDPEAVKTWEKSGQAKVVLKVDLQELLESERRARDINVTCCLIKDAGRTQIAPGEYTAIAIGPAPSELINKITGKYKLL
ncbi:hypothetical protein OJ253_604 [Cryptosporidium canis]|uniref:peptidyl-tRNA hydrolase n=1 Tax=Cryptosporidium canis TaxID=195482 RepID=A0A9D5DIV4_9CRYT|nr:hypothetical protein OJ253_604 [Cryptosporidium canis]